jgi:rhodanese-related sulfurtransferase
MPQTLHAPGALGPIAIAAALAAGAAVIDGRAPEAFDRGHVAGSVNVAAGDDAGALAAQLVARDVPVLACGEDLDSASVLAEQLGWAGFRHVRGAVAEDGARGALGRHRHHRGGAVCVDRLADELATGAVLLVDVRDDWEACQGRVPGSVHLPLVSLRAAAHLLPAVPTVTACSDGRRAAAAASALRRFGHRNVWRLAGAGVPDLLARPIGLDLLGAA